MKQQKHLKESDKTKGARIGMNQQNYNKWKLKIAAENEKSMLKGECYRVLKSEGKKIIVVEDK